MKYYFRTFIILILAITLISGCSSKDGDNKIPNIIEPNGTKKEMNGQKNGSDKTKNQVTVEESPILPDNNSDKLFESMTLEEKVGQIFIMSLRNLPEYPEVKEMSNAVKRRIQENHLGGVILFAENIETIPQTKKLIADIKAASKIPLFIAVDEEGGTVSRINKSGKMHATILPNNYIIGKTGEIELAKRVGTLIAKEISSLGFNMNFAPVADVNTNPKNPVIGDRSFGNNPKIVSEMVTAEVKGMQENSIVPVLKHFPGHGDTDMDTHTGAVIIRHDRQRLNKIELLPFQVGINNGVEAIMTAHIEMPKITNNEMPATLNKVILTDLLRKEMKFEGIIITDALEMGAISDRWDSKEASILAFEAGADILLMPFSIEEAYKGLLNAVKEGRISEERLNISVRRILKLKQNRGILDNKATSLDPEKVIGCAEHLGLAREIIEKAGLKE